MSEEYTCDYEEQHFGRQVQDPAVEGNWQLKGTPPALQPLDLDEEPELKIFLDAGTIGINASPTCWCRVRKTFEGRLVLAGSGG